MGMSNYILKEEEVFWDCVENIIKESENVYEAMERAVDLGKPMVPFMTASDIEDGVGEMWNECWSKYQ